MPTWLWIVMIGWGAAALGFIVGCVLSSSKRGEPVSPLVERYHLRLLDREKRFLADKTCEVSGQMVRGALVARCADPDAMLRSMQARKAKPSDIWPDVDCVVFVPIDTEFMELERVNE